MSTSRWTALARHWSALLLVVVGTAILVAMVVLRLSATLTADEELAEANGRVELTTVDATTERALFTDSLLLKPGQRESRCMEIATDTVGRDRQVWLDVARGQAATGDLADLLQVSIHRGRGTSQTGELNPDDFASCFGFEPEATIAADSLRTIVALPAAPVWRPPAGESTTYFRFTVELPDGAGDSLAGLQVDGIDLAFRATAEATDVVWVDRAGLFVTTLVRARAVPIGGLLLLAFVLASLQALVIGSGRRRGDPLDDAQTFEPPSLA